MATGSTNDEELEFLQTIRSQHHNPCPSVEAFQGYYPNIVPDVHTIINQPIGKIDAATDEGIKATSALIEKRMDKYAYPHECIQHYFMSLRNNLLFNGGFVKKKFYCFCPCSKHNSTWRTKYRIALREGADECKGKKFTKKEDLLQHLTAKGDEHGGYYHYGTKVYLQVLHGINSNSSRNKSGRGIGFCVPPNLQTRAPGIVIPYEVHRSNYLQERESQAHGQSHKKRRQDVQTVTVTNSNPYSSSSSEDDS